MRNRLIGKVPNIWREMPRLRRGVMLLIVAELSAIFIFPHVMSDAWYLRRYLNDERAGPAVTSFFSGSGYLQPDATMGWHNRANIDLPSWSTDEFGGRNHVLVPFARNAKARVLFLGSSKINGGTSVEIDETISAYFINDAVEALNFGTMLYGVDQSYLAYKNRYSRFDPDVVVLGLDASPEEALGNIYIPLRRRSEVLMPYVKPRFERRGGVLQEIEAPLDLLRDAASNAHPLIEFLSQHDDFFPAYSNFRSFGFTPLSYGVERALNKLNKLKMYWQPDLTEQEQLLIGILSQMERDLNRDGKQLVLLLLPDLDAVETDSGWHPAKYRHDRLVNMLEKNRLAFIDVRAAMQAQSDRLFHADAVHYTAEGNRIIAAELARYLADHGSEKIRTALDAGAVAGIR